MTRASKPTPPAGVPVHSPPLEMEAASLQRSDESMIPSRWHALILLTRNLALRNLHFFYRATKLMPSLGAIFTGFLMPGASNAALITHRPLIFATYMACCPLKGNEQSTADYKLEIEEAQSAGIDGFAIDISHWVKNPKYQTNVDKLFHAANDLSSGFKLFIMADQGDPAGGLAVDDAADLVKRFAKNTAYYRVYDRLMLSTYLGSSAWLSDVRQDLSKNGIQIFAVPFFANRDGSSIPLFAATRSLKYLLRPNNSAEGYFSFRVVGSKEFQSQVISDLSTELHKNQKSYMLGVYAYYRRSEPHLVIEDQNGLGKLISGIEMASKSGAEWLQLVTWNDWNESTYLQPFSEQTTSSTNGRWTDLLNHGPILHFIAPWLEAYKRQTKPIFNRDAAIILYRPQLKNSKCIQNARMNEIRLSPSQLSQIDDSVYIELTLLAPADIRLRIGLKTYSYRLKTGYNEIKVPASRGKVSAEVWRDKLKILHGEGALQLTDADSPSCFNVYAVALTSPG